MLAAPQKTTIGDRLSYPGGKGNCFRQIINRMPPHKIFIDAFVGGGSIVLNKKPALSNIVIDRDAVPVKNLKAAASANNAIGAGSWEFRNECAVKYLLDRIGIFGEGVLVYLDPPYLHSTRKGGDLYTCEMSEADHLALLDVAGRLSCYVMISGYWSEMYANALKGWNYSEFPNATRRGVVTESLWCNFEPNGVLHDYQYAGSNFRERERIKRKANGYVSRLMAMSAEERNCIVDAVGAISADLKPSLITAVGDPAKP